MRFDRTRRSVLPLLLATVLLAVSTLRCTPPSQPGLPPDSPFATGVSPSRSWFPQGIAVGGVTSTSAQVWLRTRAPATVELGWGPSDTVAWLGKTEGEQRRAWRRTVVTTDPSRDQTAVVALDGLAAGARYVYRARVLEPAFSSEGPPETPEPVVGRFQTAPPEEEPAPVSFVWSSDLGGQGHCRQGEVPYAIFDRMRDVQPAFAVLLGDLIYADDVCPAPPNAPGSQFIATELDQFRRKHRYQREAPSLKRFLAAVPVLATWDDHEVRNNFSGPYEPLMPVGRRAFLEYWPVRPPPEEAERLYRRARYGRDLELFVLDTRQYRSRNSDPDGTGKTMLGEEQREWLLEGLSRSSATWKVIASSVPISIRKERMLLSPGNDSWARGRNGTGFHAELERIVDTIMTRRITNVVWLAGDLHFAHVNVFDPDEDGVPDLYELVCGPLSADTVEPASPEPAFRPTTLYSEGGFLNFGRVTVNGRRLTVEIRDDDGRVRFRHAFEARSTR